MNDMLTMRNRMMDSFMGEGLTRDFMNLDRDFMNLDLRVPAPEELARSNGTGVCYSSQQFYNSADPTQNYAKTVATQFAPGILESRIAERNNRDGIERMGVRRQLGDRVAEVERMRNMTTGEETVNRNNDNLIGDENDFDREWMTVAQQTLPRGRTMINDNTISPVSVPRRHTPLAIEQRAGSEIRDRDRRSQRASRIRDTQQP